MPPTITGAGAQFMADDINQELEDTSAQVEQAPAQTVEVVADPPKDDGIQRRIDEMTATMRSYERRAEQAEQRNEQLVAALLQREQRPQEPEEQVDPQDQRRIRSVVQQDLRLLQQQQQMLQAQFEMNQVQQVAQQFEDPKVTDLAVRLLADWRKKGFTGWTPEDAVDHAVGLIAKQERNGKKGGRAPAETPAPVLTTQTGSRPAYIGGNATGRLPSNFDNLTIEQQITLLEKEGMDDLPLD